MQDFPTNGVVIINTEKEFDHLFLILSYYKIYPDKFGAKFIHTKTETVFAYWMSGCFFTLSSKNLKLDSFENAGFTPRDLEELLKY